MVVYLNVKKSSFSQLGVNTHTVVWSSLGHPLGSTQKVPCRRQCLTGDPFIHCKLAKWEQPKGALQAKVPYRGGALQGHDHCITIKQILDYRLVPFGAVVQLFGHLVLLFIVGTTGL